MRALKLDFRVRQTTPLYGWIFLLVAIGIAVLLVRYASSTYESLSVARGRLEHLQTRDRQSLPSRAEPNEAIVSQLVETRAIARSLATPWIAFLEILERLSGDDVTVISIQPETGANLVVVTIESRNLIASLNFLKSLTGQAGVHNAFLLNYQVQSQDQQKPIRSRIAFEWAGGAATSNEGLESKK